MRGPSKPTRSQPAARAALAALVCAFALAACGGDDEATSTAAPPDPSTTTTTASNGGEPSELRSQFNEIVFEALTEAEDLSPAVARCAIERLDQSVSDDELSAASAELAETGEVPAELIDAAFEAGRDCAE